MSDFKVRLPYGQQDHSEAADVRNKAYVKGAAIEIYQPEEDDEKIALELETVFSRNGGGRKSFLLLLFEREDLVKLCHKLLHLLEIPLEEQVLQTLKQIQKQLKST